MLVFPIFLVSCTTLGIHDYPYKQFYPKASENNFDKINLEGNTFFLLADEDCHGLSNSEYLTSIKSKIDTKMLPMGFKKANSDEKAYVSLNISCTTTDYATKSGFYENIQTYTDGSYIWENSLKINNGRYNINIKYNNIPFAQIDASTNSKLISFRLTIFVYRNHFRPLLASNKTIFFADDIILDSQKWDIASNELLKNLEKFNNKVPKSSKKELCIPRMGFELNKKEKEDLIISSILPNSAAKIAGLQPNDKILRYDKYSPEQYRNSALEINELLEKRTPVKIQLQRKDKIILRELTPKEICNTTP